VGEQLRDRPLVYAILFKSAAFSLILVVFYILEETLVGVLHNQTLSESVPRLAGGGVEGNVIMGIMAFVVLIPFFAFGEISRVIGKDELYSMMFTRRRNLSAVGSAARTRSAPAPLDR